MSDLKHKTDDELLETLKYTAKSISNFQAELDVLENQVATLKQRIGGLSEKRRWIVHYLEGTPAKQRNFET